MRTRGETLGEEVSVRHYAIGAEDVLSLFPSQMALSLLIHRKDGKAEAQQNIWP